MFEKRGFKVGGLPNDQRRWLKSVRKVGCTVNVGFSAIEEVAVSPRETEDASTGSASWAKTQPFRAKKERIADVVAALIRMVD